MNLRAWRNERGLTRRQFADRIGVQPNAIVKWERGERTPRPESIRRIADVTCGEVTANDFIDLHGGSEGK